MVLGVTVAAVVGVSGCFADLIDPLATTTLDFTCAMLNPGADDIVIESSLDDGFELDRSQALGSLVGQLERITGRQAGEFAFRDRPLGQHPATWTPITLHEWADARPYEARGVVFLRILWLNDLDGPDMAGAVAGAGTVALSVAAIQAGAERVDRTPAEVARVVLLHQAGHALGVVNQGIPVQDPEIQVREGPAGHEPDPASVMASGWDDARSMTWAPNATYDAYSTALLGDWTAARNPGGVCA